MADASVASTRLNSVNSQKLVITLFILSVLGYGLLNHEFGEIVIASIADAYIQVTSFVAATLFLFYGIERLFKIDITKKLSESGNFQVFFAALLGALPGCGGAIIVVTRYVSGSLSFGSVLATLTATMGDAAFLLIAKEPTTGLFIMGLGLFVGTITGYAVDKIHGKDFLRPKTSPNPPVDNSHASRQSNSLVLIRFWVMLIIPGIALGILAAFQVDIDALLANPFIAQPGTYLGFIGGLFCVFLWVAPSFLKKGTQNNAKIPAYLRDTIADTNFVTAWVVFAFLIFEIWMFSFNIDLESLFSGFALYLPLIAVVIGLLPGCGPQVIVTSMYIGGIIPLSAQIGNAISNDGDALFPAIALAPKTAIVATLYSTIPALIFGYGWFFMFE
ncbi:MAG: Uncharacterised protein [SAR116 cluster bacterium]|nr:putative manganese transporter [Alphaproteobacteria bacterium]CAI8426556.1 MAG: Uncharacterised protein [SAR116 cluster bacterium]